MSSPWDEYLRWNRAVAEVLFAEEHRDRPVYLEPDPNVLAEIARRVGSQTADPELGLKDVVLPTLALSPTDGSFLHRHVAATALWRLEETQDPPPCLGLLLLLSIVAGKMAGDGDVRANNYYGRLCQYLGVADEQRDRIVREYGRGTPGLWRALNEWLDAANGARGIPTAYAFDWRRFIGVPISQALVRAEDRKKLGRFFASSRMQPRQQLPTNEMEELLGRWIPSSNVSASIKRLWPTAKERIAEIACIELEGWNGISESPDAEGRRELQLLVTAELRLRPLLSLRLNLMVRESGQVPKGRYAIGSASSEGARLAFEGDITLEDAGLDGWLELTTPKGVAVVDALVSNLDLQSSRDPDFRLRRRCRRLILFRHSAESNLYYEVTRAELLVTHMVLCHSSLAAELQKVLREVARPGYETHWPSDSKAVPEPWVLFRGIQIAGDLDTTIEDFFPLQPSTSTQIALTGGFALPGRATWHRDALPEISVAALDSTDCDLSLHVAHVIGEESRIKDRSLGKFRSGTVIQLPNSELSDGDYRLLLDGIPKGRKAQRRLAAVSLRVRSSRSPRPGPVEAAGHQPGSGIAWSLSASAMESGCELYLRGAYCTWPLPDLSDRCCEIPVELPTRSDATREEFVAEVLRPARVEAPGCLSRGYHYFVVPPAAAGAKKFRPTLCQCRDCDLEKWFRPARKKRATEDAPGEGDTRPRRTATQRPVKPPDSSGGMDRLLDALSYARWGSWTSFVSIAGQIDDSPWFPTEAAQVLSALGHIDMVLDSKSLVVSEWRVSPTAIARIGEQEALVCGWRVPRHLERLRDDVEALGGQLSIESQPDGPARIRILGLDLREISDVAASASTSLRDEIVVCNQPGVAIASLLPSLPAVANELYAHTWLGRQLQYFDVRACKWRDVSDASVPGSYLFRGHPRIYAYASSEDLSNTRFRRVDYRMAKHLAARDAGIPLLAYDSEKEELVVPLGAELPSLYDRAAVLCSGLRPASMSDGTVRYPRVPHSVASVIYRSIYPPVTV